MSIDIYQYIGDATFLLNNTYVLSYNYTYGLLSTILVSDWFILSCSGNLILHKKEKWEKHRLYDEKQNKNVKKTYENIKQHSLLRTHPTDTWYDILQFRDGENITDQKLSVEHTPVYPLRTWCSCSAFVI